jgi:hypothetical protein
MKHLIYIWGRLINIIMNLELSEIFNLNNVLNQFLQKEYYEKEESLD